jgi:hypothetical protein
MAVGSLELTDVQSSTFLLDYLTSYDRIFQELPVTPDRS